MVRSRAALSFSTFALIGKLFAEIDFLRPRNRSVRTPGQPALIGAEKAVPYQRDDHWIQCRVPVEFKYVFSPKRGDSEPTAKHEDNVKCAMKYMRMIRE